MISNKIIVKEFFMELVYLWVEKYKNIDKQGFNFLPRFRCEYDEDTKELKIIDKDEMGEFYPKNFFGDNINVTAIVGENGSGKSSLIMNIPNPQYNDSMKHTDYILVYEVCNEIKIISNIELKSKYVIDELYKYPFDYFSFNQDFLNRKFIKNFSSYVMTPLTYNNNLLSDIYNDSNYNIDLYKYQCIINQLIFKYSSINNIFSFNTKKIKLTKTFVNIKKLFEKLKNSLEKETYLGEYQNEPINIYEYLFFKFDELSDKEKFLIYLLLKHYQKNKNAIKIVHKIFEEPDLTIFDLETTIFNFENKDLEMQILKRFYLLIDNENIYNKRLEINELKDELDVFINFDIQNILDIEFYDEFNRNFKDLSQGERHIFSFVLLIYDKLFKQEKKNKLILLDEPDITLHPQWQKKLISSLIKTFNKVKDFSIHFVITSHSPFILSDLPKENIIFLEKGKQVYPFDDEKQTFGANIHTLLSHGFFMKDGLMGEFAKDKIDTAIKYLNQKILTQDELDYCENIISIIGEPIIKRQLQKMLDSKKLSEIDIIKKQIAELQEELEKKENKK